MAQQRIYGNAHLASLVNEADFGFARDFDADGMLLSSRYRVGLFCADSNGLSGMVSLGHKWVIARNGAWGSGSLVPSFPPSPLAWHPGAIQTPHF